ncbi:leucine-rich repeat protein [Lachnospiraceae bacterium 46-15]
MSLKHLTISHLWKRSLGIVTAGAMVISMLPSLSLTVSAGATTRPSLLKAGSIPVSAENFTRNEPFARGTAGCERFRIPALITLQNGDLLATADARYGVVDGSDAPDGGGLDSIASVSSDGGKTWYYSFPFYFPDSDGYPGNSTRANATTIIDPGVVEGPDGTIYCIADVNPTGVTTMNGFKTPGTGTGYVDVNGTLRLALTSDYSKSNNRPDGDNAGYEYYVGDFNEEGFAPVLNMEDGTPSAYGVDEWYNLYSVENGEYKDTLRQVQVKQESADEDEPDVMVQQNAFYAGSDLHVYRTGYIMSVESKDHGRTWDNPQILNTQIKKEGETALLVSPGKGTTISNGDITIGFYKTAGGEQASMVYSTDNGSTWQRTENIPTTEDYTCSSEDEIVELGDGTLRMFFRRGGYMNPVGTLAYADIVKQPDGTYEMGAPKASPASHQTGCNLSAISYSKKIDGKQVILVACPSGVRANGVIHTLLVNDDAEHSMELINTFKIPEGQGGYASFVYCSLTELEDGSLGLLWEPNHYAIRFSRFDISDVIPNKNVEGTTAKINLESGNTFSKVYNYEGNITQAPDNQVVSISKENTHFAMYDHTSDVASSLDSFSAEANLSLLPSDAEFTFTGSGNTWKIESKSKKLHLTNQTSAESFFSTTAANMTVTPTAGQNTFRICKEDGTRYIIFNTPNMTFNTNTNYTNGDSKYEIVLLEKQDKVSETDTIPGYKQVSSITNGKKYLIAHLQDNKAIILYPTNGTAAQTKLLNPAVSVNNPTLTFTGLSAGYTTAVIDGIRYQIRVTEEHGEADSGCSHSIVVKNAMPASCEDEGYTGDKVCSLCGGLIEAGEDIPSLGGHKWDNGNITKEVSRTEDGIKVYTCQNDAFHKKTEIIYSSAFSILMDAYENTRDLIGNLDMYEADTAKSLKEAYDSAQQAVTSKDSDRAEMYRLEAALTAAKNALKPKNTENLKDQLAQAVTAAQTVSQEGVSADVWNTFQDALQKASAPVPDDAEAEDIWTLLKNLNQALKDLNDAKEMLVAEALATAKNNLAAAVSQAKSIYAKGQGNYTPETWNAFTTAYNAASNPPANADASALKTLLDNLTRAQGNLKQTAPVPVPQPEPITKKGDILPYKGVDYKVLDVKKLTVSAAKCQNKKMTSVTIPVTVKINGKSYKVVQIDANAFKNCTKLKQITIGANVASIGKNSFQGCKKLSKVTLKGTKLKNIKSGAFKKTSSKMTVKAPKKLKKAQRTALLKKMKKAGMSKKAKIK